MLRHEQRQEAAPIHSLPLAMKPLEISAPTIRWSELEIGRLLGSGSFSRVHQVSKTEGSDELYDNLAIKMPLPQSADNETLDMAKVDLLNEATILARLSHTNIINLLFVSDPSNPTFFLVVSRLDDTLDKRIEEWRKTKQLTKSFAAWKPQPFASRLEAVRARVEEVALGIANGLEYLHSKGIAHRDIKPQNVGFDEFDTVVLFDFGLSRQVRRGQQNSQPEQDLHKSLESIDFDMVSDDYDDIGSAVGSDGESSYYDLTRTSTGVAGSPRYMAPELVREEEYGLAVDTYSFGIMLWEIATLKQAFHKFRGVEDLFENVHGPKRLRPDLIKNKCFASMSNFAKLLHNMWQDDSKKRPSMQRVRVELEAIVEAQKRGQLDEGHGPQARNGANEISLRDLFVRRASINMGRLSRMNQRGIKRKNSTGRRNSL